MKIFQYISGLACVLVLVTSLASCLDSNESETVVTNFYNTIVTKFSLEDNSNVCSGLSGYSFTIDNYGLSDDSIHSRFPNDGIIFNPDSLPVGTIADSIKVSLSFTAPDSVYFKLYGADGVLGQYSIFSKDSALYFASFPDCRMTVVARGGNRKTYHIKVNVHKVTADSIIWHDYTPELWADMNITDQRTDTLSGAYCWYIEEDGIRNKVSKAPMGATPATWQSMADVVIPEGDVLDLASLYNWHDALYAVGKHSQNLLRSTDGYNWEVSAPTDYTFQTILGNQYRTQDVYGHWNSDSLNAIVRINNHYHFAVSDNASDWQIRQQIPANFPITGFSRPIWTPARSNYGNLTSRLYLVGGITAEGKLTSSTWSCDGWSDMQQGPNWAEFTQDELKPLYGASVLEYTIDSDHPKSFWILQPGISVTGDVPTNRLFGKLYTTLYYSQDNGVSWHRLSRYYTQYADNTPIGQVSCSSAFYNPRTYQMYFFGGRYADGSFRTTVWGGTLNSLTFDKKR